jgi:hypothetical protein
MKIKWILIFLLYTPFASQAQQWTTSGINIYNANTGNVGIGVTSPLYKLSLSSTSQNVLSVKSSSHSIINIESGIGLNSYLQFAPNGVLKWDLAGETTGNLRIYDYAASLARLTITPTGNIGIGTTAPVAKLHALSTTDIGVTLNSEVLITRFSTSVANLQSLDLKLRKYSTTDNYWWGNSLRLQRNIDNAVNSCYIDFGASETNVGSGSHELGFGVDNSEYMRISYGGNVGIGTTAPDAKLAVKGTIHANEVKVDLNGAVAPDYVFNSDYNLLSLEEIKTYIDKNKHLPEVPSAKEMEVNGVQLGEMNMLLLKKIEELTLYTIDMNKKLQELTIESEEQRKEIIQLKAKESNPSKK